MNGRLFKSRHRNCAPCLTAKYIRRGSRLARRKRRVDAEGSKGRKARVGHMRLPWGVKMFPSVCCLMSEKHGDRRLWVLGEDLSAPRKETTRPKPSRQPIAHGKFSGAVGIIIPVTKRGLCRLLEGGRANSDGKTWFEPLATISFILSVSSVPRV